MLDSLTVPVWLELNFSCKRRIANISVEKEI